MKHIKVNGQLLNVDKSWSHLKPKQKDWIFQRLREEYMLFLKKEEKHPNKLECNKIVHNVYTLIEESGIWIPYNEVKKAFNGKLNRYRKIDII